MKSLCLLSFALCLLAQAPKADKASPKPAVGRPNFSGAWELLLGRSDFGRIPAPQKVVDVIEHRPPKIKVKSTVALAGKEYTAEMNYTTDGQTNVNFEPGGDRIKSRSRWSGAELVTESEIEIGFDTTKFRERWRLADGGKTFINDRVIASKTGDVVQRLVYARK